MRPLRTQPSSDYNAALWDAQPLTISVA